ncbi:hypothetical protein [Lichenibacterium dinghuense]|uniref:COG3904 family protein n=1 Tax=Lichenibacterium dinghuense TaxID=2895977 RepID=UPI001F304746|nr:hypothetical protein [Lichenibacterium sp. 6Y81]
MPRPTPNLPAVLVLLAVAALPRPAAAFTPSEAKMPMTVTLVRSDAPGCGADCPRWLALTGQIGAGTPALFAAALARLGRSNVPVLVDSPGGSVQAAMAMGRAIRARGMTVAVAGTSLDDCAPADRACAALRQAGERPGFVAGGVAACASACVLILAAGKERSVGPNSYVGVHQMVVHQTLTRVMNYFRVMRRMVHGHPVEVSRTLVETRPISSRQVVKAASETMYSEVDRYLLGLGIAESIMPLMRSAPPSGIHWMTLPEVASTRIATEAAEARVLVERSAAPARTAPERPSVMAVATSRLGPAAQLAGIVDWSLSRADGAPALAASVEIPARPLRGTLALRRDEAPGGAGGFVAALNFGEPASIEPGRVWTVGAPSICKGSECLPYFTAAAETDDGHGARAFRVRAGWSDGFLEHLADGTSVSVPLTADDGSKGWVSLSLTDQTRATVRDWEHLCCGLAPAEAATAAGTIAGPPTPDEKPATASWTVQREGTLPPQPGTTYLTGSIAVPSVGLALSLRAGLAQRVGSGSVVLTIDAAADAARFGPLTDVAVETVMSPDGRAAVLPAVASRRGGLHEVLLGAGAPLPPDPSLALVLTDGQGRRIRVAVRFPSGLADLLRASTRPAS